MAGRRANSGSLGHDAYEAHDADWLARTLTA